MSDFICYVLNACRSYNVPQTRSVCTGCRGGLTNKTCKEPKKQETSTKASHHQPDDASDMRRSGVGTRLSDWDPTYMSWAPADGARSSSAWSEPVLIGAPVPQMDTNFAAVIDDDGGLVGMWRCAGLSQRLDSIFALQSIILIERI